MPAYELPPIDWFPGVTKFDPREVPAEPIDATWFDGPLTNPIVVAYQIAEPLFKTLGWEGDGQWYFGGIPDENTVSVWVMVKQSNNGMTYVFSERPLPWLDGIAFAHIGRDDLRPTRP